MSLINQMLKDLEQRGGFPSDTKFEPAKTKSLGTEQVENKGKYTFLKISGALILLYCAVYIWVKNPNIFKAPHVSQTANVPVTPVPTAPSSEKCNKCSCIAKHPSACCRNASYAEACRPNSIRNTLDDRKNA